MLPLDRRECGLVSCVTNDNEKVKTWRVKRCVSLCTSNRREDEDHHEDGRAPVKSSSCMRLCVESACSTLRCGSVAGSPVIVGSSLQVGLKIKDGDEVVARREKLWSGKLRHRRQSV